MDNVSVLGFLKLPIDLAAQRYDPLFDFDTDAIGGTFLLPFQDFDGACSDLIVPALRVQRQADLDFLSNRSDAFDTPRGALCSCLLGIARDKAGQSDNTSVRGDTDMGGVDRGFEFEFIEYVTPKL